jgi:hypothetical protein
MTEETPIVPPEDWERIHLKETPGDVGDIWHVFTEQIHWISVAGRSQTQGVINDIRLLAVYLRDDGQFYVWKDIDVAQIIKTNNLVPPGLGGETNDHLLVVGGEGSWVSGGVLHGGVAVGLRAGYPGNGVLFLHFDGQGNFVTSSLVGCANKTQGCGTLTFNGQGGSGTPTQWVMPNGILNSMNLFLSASVNPGNSALSHVRVSQYYLSADDEHGGQVLARWSPTGLTPSTPSSQVEIVPTSAMGHAMATGQRIGVGHWLVTLKTIPTPPTNGDDGNLYRQVFDDDFESVTDLAFVDGTGFNHDSDGRRSRPHTLSVQTTTPYRPGTFLITCYSSESHLFMLVDYIWRPW